MISAKVCHTLVKKMPNIDLHFVESTNDKTFWHNRTGLHQQVYIRKRQRHGLYGIIQWLALRRKERTPTKGKCGLTKNLIHQP